MAQNERPGPFKKNDGMIIGAGRGGGFRGCRQNSIPQGGDRVSLFIASCKNIDGKNQKNTAKSVISGNRTDGFFFMLWHVSTLQILLSMFDFLRLKILLISTLKR